MKPTIQEIDHVIFDYERQNGEDFDSRELAERIHSLYSPPMKPLSELASDKKAIEEIYFEVTSQFPEIYIMQREDCIILNAAPGSIILYFNGRIHLPFNNEASVNYFKLIRLINSLGYDVTPETK